MVYTRSLELAWLVCSQSFILVHSLFLTLGLHVHLSWSLTYVRWVMQCLLLCGAMLLLPPLLTVVSALVIRLQ